MKRVIWINVVLGIWLIISPFVLGYAGSSAIAVTNDVIFGVLLTAGSLWIVAGLAGTLGISLFEAVCGIWLLIAPFVLGLSTIAGVAANEMIVGIIVLVTSLAVAWTLMRPPVRAA